MPLSRTFEGAITSWLLRRLAVAFDELAMAI
jgi:hypothetical protein